MGIWRMSLFYCLYPLPFSLLFRSKSFNYNQIVLPIFLYIFDMYSHFQPFWASGGFLGAFGSPGSLVGTPRALISGLTSIATLTLGLVQPPVQLGKFTDFWGRLYSLRFQRCNNNHHCHRGKGGGWRPVCHMLPATSDFFYVIPKAKFHITPMT